MIDRLLRHRLRALSTALAITCLGPCVLLAQEASLRPAIDQLRRALDSTWTTAQVGVVAANWRASSPRAVGRLGDAFIEFRLGVLTNDRRSLISSWELFDQVVRAHPDWPYARFGLAVTALDIYGRRYPVPAAYDGVVAGTHYDGYALQMNRTLHIEPTFPPAISWLADNLGTEGSEPPPAVLQALRLVADSSGATDPRIELILARADRMLGAARQSLARIDAYVREGGDSGVADLETARSMASMGLLETAAGKYIAGAAVRTDQARAIYRSDISPVATAAELARFDGLRTDSVASFITRFWSERDLQEHLARWVYVSRNFRVPPDVFIPSAAAACQPDQVFDQRAILYLRYGERMSPAGPGVATTSYHAGDRANPALSNRYDPGLLSGADVMSTGTGSSANLGVPTRSRTLSEFRPQPVANVRNITWVYLVDGQPHQFVPGSCLGR